MKKPTILMIIKLYFKDAIALVGWKMFLWASDTTQEKYWKHIHQQEQFFIDFPNPIEAP